MKCNNPYVPKGMKVQYSDIDKFKKLRLASYRARTYDNL